MQDQSLSQKKLRSKHNSEILKKMQEGEDLTRYSTEASWFPVRPIIKKDGDAIRKLFTLKNDSDKAG